MLHEQVKLREMDNGWVWYCLDSKGAELCHSLRGFLTPEAAMADFSYYRSEYTAYMRWRFSTGD